jgi:hypothetical protein
MGSEDPRATERLGTIDRMDGASACQTSIGPAEFSCIASKEYCQMLRIFKVLAGLTSSLVGQIAIAQEPPPTPALPKPIPFVRFVPSGEEWTIGNVVALNPDCSSRGRIVGRVVENPTHGEVAFESEDIFPSFPQPSPLFACNSKRVPGLLVKYRSEANFIGQDNMKIFWIFPDGSGGQWDYTLIVK